ncbi:hypothetical protein [Sphingomonas sp.]|uniref:hypothetical protein n=1 Tax=Sphingomonas sp. TaxID=28214 RepID=UPI001DB07617|nr:hypothetical protein [Sphingomonas sp.]MBX9795273.1 hypothetical protein [Sphingomonas sp.]
MTAAYRLRGLGWLVTCVIVALGCYMVSLQVAAVRKQVADTDRAIARAMGAIRQLETEFGTRANLAQLERWNAEDIMLDAPRAEQFVPDEQVLAALDPATLGGVDTQLITAPAAVTATPAAAPAPVALAQVAPAPRIRRAETAEAPARPVLAMASVAAVSPRASSAPRNLAMIDRQLLSDPAFADFLDAPRRGRH